MIVKEATTVYMLFEFLAGFIILRKLCPAKIHSMQFLAVSPITIRILYDCKRSYYCVYAV